MSAGFVPKDAATPSEPAQPGLLERTYETSGIKGLVDAAEAKTDADHQVANEIRDHIKAGRWGDATKTLLKQIGGAALEGAKGPGGDFLESVGKSTYQHGKQAVDAVRRGDTKEAIAQGAEAVPVVGQVGAQIAKPLAQDIADKNWSGVAGDVRRRIPAILSTAKMAGEGLKSPSEAAETAIPKDPVVAGTELPRTVGQAASEANPAGLGADVKGIEDVARRIPGSGRLREISTKQQAGARQILTDKARTAVPGEAVEASNAPESIEQNAANAAESARQAGSAKYQELAKAAADAEFDKPVEAAHSILQDENISKVLPKSARDALNKVASGLTGREEISQQIYGRPFADLDAAKQVEVGKAMTTGPRPADPFADIIKARSEIGDAANGMKDAADRFQAHKALDQFDQAISDALNEHDIKAGTNLSQTLSQAKQLWSQKYAFEQFRDGLQDIMREQPHTGNRQINGAAFQKLINDLDPRAAKGKTPLQRMFPDDPQSVKDLHDLGDFIGEESSAGGRDGEQHGETANSRIEGKRASAHRQQLRVFLSTVKARAGTRAPKRTDGREKCCQSECGDRGDQSCCGRLSAWAI